MRVRTPSPTGVPDGSIQPWPYLILAVILWLCTLPAFLEGYGLAAVLMSAMFAAPAAVVWRRPMAGWGLSLLPLAVLLPLDRHLGLEQIDSYSWLILQAPVQLPVMYAVSRSTRPRACYPATMITLTAVGCSQLYSDFGAGVAWQNAALLSLATILMLILGRFRAYQHTARTRISEEERLRQGLEERTRLARELHDAVAHHLSVISVQAATAPHRIDTERPETDQEFQAIGTSARQALHELRQLLGVLRGTSPEPVPTLSDLPRLIESTRLAGVPVRLTMIGSSAPPACETGYAAYRIVQEALSNVIRHAAGADTTVRITTEPTILSVEVINNRPPGPRLPPSPPGHGLTGIRERAEAAGGTVAVGPTDQGGFQVRAALPLEPDRPPASPTSG